MTASNELLELVVAQIWQVTILCVVAGWLSKTLLRTSPVLKYYLGVVVLLKSVTPPLWASHCGIFSWLFQSLSTATSTFVSHLLGPKWSPQHIALVAISIWSVGFLFSLIRTFMAWRIIQQRIDATTIPASRQLLDRIEELKRKLGIQKTIRVALTNESLGPAILGVWQPTMILPLSVVSCKTAEDLEPILAHELLHVRRGDTWVAMLETIARACWWFHPQVQRTADETSQAGELCCDEDVLRELFYAPRRYAESLLDVCEAKCRLQPHIGGAKSIADVAATRGVRVEQVTRDRLRRIMTAKTSRPRQMLNTGLLILGLLIVLPGSSVEPPDHPDNTARSAANVLKSHVSDPVRNQAASLSSSLLN